MLRVSQVYELAGLRVIGVGGEKVGPRVRATLLEDGTGLVEMAHAYKPEPEELEIRYHTVNAFLKGIGSGDAHYLIQLCVKHWFAHSLGPLVVFPSDLGFAALHDLIQSGTNVAWKNNLENLAYFLPMLAVKSSNATKSTFGSRVARSVFEGGGPFVMEDSVDLVERALRRLDYLDDELNADMEEAMFCFLNHSNNKHNLRKLAMLPSSGDTSRIVQEALRAVFLSNDSSGQWWKLPTGSKSFLLHALEQERLINPDASASYSDEDLFEAMKVYGRRHGLPAMRTFSGLVKRIHDHVDVNPSKRGLIEIGP